MEKAQRFDSSMICKWFYRPAVHEGDHFAIASCDHGSKYLSKIIGEPQEIGVADFYNGKQCPSCGRAIRMDYRDLMTMLGVSHE